MKGESRRNEAEVKDSATTARTSRRSALTIMLRLVGLVRPAMAFMILAILMGVWVTLPPRSSAFWSTYALQRYGICFIFSYGVAGGMLLFAHRCGLLRYARAGNATALLRLNCLRCRDRVFFGARKRSCKSLRSKNKAT